MRTSDLEELYPYELIKALKDLGVELTPEQKRALYTCNRTFLYTNTKMSVNTNFLWRLTLPIAVLTIIVMIFIIQPIKWLITGNYYFDSNSIIFEIIRTWGKKVGINHL